MTKDKKVKKLIVNKLTKEQYKNIATKYDDELYNIIDEAHYTEQEINDIISVKQNKLIAGEGIEILDDGTINNTYTSTNWGNINGNISEQTDLKDILNYKVDKTIGTQIIPEIPTEPVNLEIIGNQECGNGIIVKGNLISLYKNLLFKCYERGSTIICNYDEEIENLGYKMCDGTFSGHYTEINPKDSFTFKPFVWEVTSPVQYETSDFCRLHLFSHDLQENSMHVTLLKIEAYIYDTLTNSKKWVTVYNYSGASKDIGQTGFGLYRAGYSLEDYYSIFGIRITISGSPDTTFNLSQIQLVTSRNTVNLADSLQCVSNSGGTIWGDLDVSGSITASTQNIDTNNNTVATTKFVKDTSANLDLSNLSTTGQAKFDAKVDVDKVLNKTQITNCITEIPQRIKYTLEDGTLTIKAGSVVIVPYGVEDLTATYPVGSTFINENFKVYDTQYADGKFFVWAEIVEDIVRASSTVATDAYRNVVVMLNSNFLGSVTSTQSGATDPTNLSTYVGFYNTTTNYIGLSEGQTTPNYNNIVAFPPMIVQSLASGYMINSVTQVFNGIGYIGSTVWVDKGVKGLIPNGRNEDGTLKNIEARTESVLTFTTTNAGDRYFSFKTPINGVWTGIDYKADYGLTIGTKTYSWYYSEADNYWLHNGQRLDWIDFAHATLNASSPFNITSFVPKTPINLSNVVHATGNEEIRGVKRFIHNTWGQVIVKGSDMDITTAPSATKYIGIDFRDRQEARLGFIGISQNVNNDRTVVFQHQNSSKFYFDGAVMIRQKFGSAVAIATNWTATASGVVHFEGYSDSSGKTFTGWIDGVRVYQNTQTGANANGHTIGVTVPIQQGQVVTYSGGGKTLVEFRPYVSI